MFERIKPEPEIKERGILINFFEEEVESEGHPRVKLMFEIPRYRLA
ncbi:hypothetical protein [Thermococcus sp.]|nr:hypothetical protein [Thermococcus sp.]